MRALPVLLGVIIAAQSARAETVVVMSEPGAELDSALRVVMAGRGVGVAGAPQPLGAFRLERAAIAQRTAVQIGADAAVWIDEADVCAVTADGHHFRHAPMPLEAASPRVFAAIATSLLDEMIRPEAWAQAVDVNVNVEVTARAGGPRVAVVEGLGAPGLVDADVAVVPAPFGRAHAGRTLIEIGPMLSPLTIGVQGGVLASVTPAWRLGVNASLNETFDGEYTLGVAAAELRHVGAGRKHWDFGPEVGIATDGIDPVVFAGFRIARTWELSQTALSLAFTPLLLAPLDDGSTTPPVFPGIYSSLRWQVPL